VWPAYVGCLARKESGPAVIEIEEPPDKKVCASCASVLSWLYSPVRGGWICVVRKDNQTFQLHGCRHAQEPRLWRQAYRGDPPSGEYLQVRAQIASTKERS
jgi:hypothetical protein